MATVLPILAVTCHYCSRPRNPKEVARLSSGVFICWHCLEWHERALRALAGEPPPGCQQCGIPFHSLEETESNGNVQMSLVPKDGIYQVLCRKCSNAYLLKRRDLYRSTAYKHIGA